MSRLHLHFALPIMMGLCLTAKPLTAQQQVSATHKTAVSTGPEYVGSETCALCHADIAKKFSDNPHSKLALLHGGTGATCESCHGPGGAHVASGGDVAKIIQLGKASAKQVDVACLGCHVGVHPDFMRSPHAKAGVSCASCHSIHKPGEEADLLKVSQPLLCYTCHTDMKPAFSMPFHHKVDEGLIKCSDCHDVHGTFGMNNLRSTADQSMICVKCHSEVRGPFAFEHPPVKGEGCLSCHTPHGSQNARLLNVPNVNTLCIQCHSEIAGNAIPGTTPVDTGHNQNGPTVACTNCHSQIHGSNVSQYFLQ
jgi:DmsE family decaheme c-type cytochrome